MSFARTVTLGILDHRYDLIYFSYGFSRDTDHKGRPSSGICGGMISLTMESTKSTELLELFFNTDSEYPTDHPPRTISGNIEVCDPEDGRVIRRLAFEEAFIVHSEEEMHSDSPLPIMETITISPLRLDIDRTIRLDRRWPQTSGGWQKYVQEERPVEVAPERPQVYVRKVEGPSEGLPHETFTYKAVEYTSAPEDSDRQDVKWQVKIGDTIEQLSQKGETIEIKLKEEWVGQEITVMAYLHSPDENVSAKTKVKLEAVIVFVNGYWNSGESDVVGAPNTIQDSQVATYRMLKRFIAEKYIGAQRGLGYWKGQDNIRDFLIDKYKTWTLKEISQPDIDYIYYDGAGVWHSSGNERFGQGFERHRSKADLVNDQQLKGKKVVNDKGEQMKRIFVISHSMGGAHAEGLLASWKYHGLEVECVVHFSAADNRDFSITFPAATWQINISPDPVLAYKNFDDRISDYTQNFLDWFRVSYKEINRQIYFINGIIHNHYIEHESEDLMGHMYTKILNHPFWTEAKYF